MRRPNPNGKLIDRDTRLKVKFARLPHFCHWCGELVESGDVNYVVTRRFAEYPQSFRTQHYHPECWWRPVMYPEGRRPPQYPHRSMEGSYEY